MKRLYVKPQLTKVGLLSAITAGGKTSGKGMLSDARLKTDITKVGHAANGLSLYHFRYLWSDALYEGVMAQEVAETFPHAVSTLPCGYMGVRYDLLGMKMTRVH